MNNKEFIAQLATKTGFTQTDTQQMVRTLISEMKLHLEDGDTIQINGFGSFEVKKRLERIVVTPGTQQRMLVPPKLVLNFKPIASIKENLKKPQQRSRNITTDSARKPQTGRRMTRRCSQTWMT